MTSFVYGFLVLGYFIGSIPFGLLVTKLSGLGDLRKIGSGNIGATNVLRTGNKSLAMLTLILDGGKAAALIGVFQLISNHYQMNINPETSLAIGLCAMIGHCFPVWLRFNGGKGVATAGGALLVATPITGLFCIFTWIAGALLSRRSSVASLLAASLCPLISAYFYGITVSYVTLAISCLIIFRHRDNIQRLLRGEEKPISFSSQKT
jgi:glycerol-3-phosphate acyltransferase PlsY